jgi:hypothetical protein
VGKRILVVSDDRAEVTSVVRELGTRFEVLCAFDVNQAYGFLARFEDLAAVVCSSAPGPFSADLMKGVQRRKPGVMRLIATSAPPREAEELVRTGVANRVIGRPWAEGMLLAAVRQAVDDDAPPAGLRSEPRWTVKIQVPVASVAWNGFVPLWTRDTSLGGAFFLFAERVVPISGSRATLQLGAEKAEAQVAHVVSVKLAAATGADAGFGVSFLKKQPTDWWSRLVITEKAAAPVAAKPAGVFPSAPLAPPTAKELESAKNFHSAGSSLLQAGNFGAARQKFELAARLAPEPRFQAMPLVCNGMQFLRLGVLDKAEESLQRAVVLFPGCSEARDGLVELATKRSAKPR